MRQALGVAVFFGMIGVTAFGLLFTPVFYVVMRKLAAHLPQVSPRLPLAQATAGRVVRVDPQDCRPPSEGEHRQAAGGGKRTVRAACVYFGDDRAKRETTGGGQGFQLPPELRLQRNGGRMAGEAQLTA